MGGCAFFETMAYFIGIDLGKLSDHTALVINECVSGEKLEPLRKLASEAGFEIPPNSIGHIFTQIRQWPLNTDYTKIAQSIKRAVDSCPELRGSTCVVEVNGPGLPALEIFLLHQIDLNFVPVMTTAGMVSTSTGSDTIVHVGKNHLVGIVQSALQGGRLAIADSEHKATLQKELELFGVEITKSGNEKFEAIGEAHDDLVMAAAMALWGADTYGAPKNVDDHFISVLHPGGIERKMGRANGTQDQERMDTAVFGRTGRPDRASDPFRKGTNGGTGRKRTGFIDPIHRRDHPK
jgi:hypothetical protein